MPLRRTRRSSSTTDREPVQLGAGSVGMPSKSPLEGSASTETLKMAPETFRQSERAFQASVVRYARLMGWTTYHTHDSRRSDAGFPDLVLVRRPRVVFAELKSQRGRLRPSQRAWIEELRACGQAVYVWRPSTWEEVERVLR